MRLILCFLIAIIATVVSSCFCIGVACDQNPPDAYFRLLSSTTGEDLVFGSTGIYDKDQIKFFSLLATDTTFFKYYPIQIEGEDYDSVLYVNFYPLTEVSFMQLSNGDIDTLNISFMETDGGCCGPSTVITNFRYNGSMDIPADTGIQILMK